MDQIDQAIAAVPPAVNLVEVRVQIASTGRPVIMLVPDDLTDGEVVELGGFVLIGMRGHIAQMKGPASRLILPGRA